MSLQRGDLTQARILAYIDANYQRAIAPHDVARALNYSLSHLTHRTRALLGASIGDLLLQRRLNAARHLLSETTLPVSRIAVCVGFTDVAYFSRRFSQDVGMSPSQWRRAQLHTAVCHACGRALPSIAPLQNERSELADAAS